MPSCPPACRLASNDKFARGLDNITFKQRNIGYPRSVRSAANPLQYPVDSSILTLQQEFDAAIGQVTYVTAETFRPGLTLHEISKTDPLYAAANQAPETAYRRHVIDR